MMKTTFSSLIAVAANAVAIREHLEAQALAQQNTLSNWQVLQGMCQDANGVNYDYWEVNGVRNGWGGGGHITLEQCVQDCHNTPECVGVNHSANAGRCGLRVADGAQVTIDAYECPWDVGTATGPATTAMMQGDWSCYVNPDFGKSSGVANWQKLDGMCNDAHGNQYDHWEVNGVSAGWGNGGRIDLEQCAQDCLKTPHCVGINQSPSRGQCLLRMEDGEVVSLPHYESPQSGYLGVGPVAGSSPQGDYVCYVNPEFSSNGTNSDYTCDLTVNFYQDGPSYSQIDLTGLCSTGNCAGNPVYGMPNDNMKAIAYCEDECTDRRARGEKCEGFFFQKHNNGKEICGFYAEGMDQGTQKWDGHQAGAICRV